MARGVKIHSMAAEVRLLDKSECIKEAARILREGLIDGMSESQIAKEIYFHAVVYDICKRTGKFPHFLKHSDPIDIESGGDTRARRAIYSACWLIPSRRRKRR